MRTVVGFIFLLATFELIHGRYLLINVEDEPISGSRNSSTKVESRSRHDRCWWCITYWCRVYDPEHYPLDIHKACHDYGDDNIYPSKRELVQCAMVVCDKAEDTIEENCVNGGPDPAGMPGPEPLNARAGCRDEE